MNPRKDRTAIGDLVTWNVTRGHAYFDSSQHRRGILIKKLENYEYWLYADVLDEKGVLNTVMLYKEDNPI